MEYFIIFFIRFFHIKMVVVVVEILSISSYMVNTMANDDLTILDNTVKSLI